MTLFGNLFAEGGSKVEKVNLKKRYDLIGRVGQGSMSKVWRADDQIHGHLVAIKVLDKEKTKRFEYRFKDLKKPSEGEIALSLKHPYIVRTHEVGYTEDDEMFLVMDYVEGSALSLLIDLQTEQLRQYRTRYMIQIGEALSYFHRKNYIHRDVCPRNIIVSEENDIKLIDFGLAVPNTPDFRKPGNRTGTANYMAPELIKRRPTDQRIDIFSYAVTCFEMYSKRHPWDAAMTIDAVLQHINQPPVQLKELVSAMDAEVAEIIMKGLEADPRDRWATIDEMVAALRKAEVRLVKQTRDLLKRREKAKLRAAKESAAKSQKSTSKDTGSVAESTFSQEAKARNDDASKSASTSEQKPEVDGA